MQVRKQQLELDMEQQTGSELGKEYFNIGEGNGNPLQCSCLESPEDGRAWWAAIYGVVQSWTRLE